MFCMTLCRVRVEPRDGFTASLVLEEGPGQAGLEFGIRKQPHDPSSVTSQRHKGLGFWSESHPVLTGFSWSRGSSSSRHSTALE